MAIVKVHNKTRNITYVYESETYWDKELRQPRPHRKLIGLIGSETGDVAPAGRKGKAEPAIANRSDADHKALHEQALAAIDQKGTLIQGLQSRIDSPEAESRAYQQTIGRACGILTDPVPEGRCTELP